VTDERKVIRLVDATTSTLRTKDMDLGLQIAKTLLTRMSSSHDSPKDHSSWPERLYTESEDYVRHPRRAAIFEGVRRQIRAGLPRLV
jgi:hypothetical protein